MDPNQIKLIIGILFLIFVASMFFKTTRKLAFLGVFLAIGLFVGFVLGIGISKEAIKKQNPICYKAIYELGKK